MTKSDDEEIFANPMNGELNGEVSFDEEVGEDMQALSKAKEVGGDMRALFDGVDADGGGTIDKEEIAKLAERLGAVLTKKELNAAFTEMMDYSADKKEVDFEGFNKWWENRDKSSRFGALTVMGMSTGTLMPECFTVITGLEGSPRGEDNEQGAVAVMYEKAMQEREEVKIGVESEAEKRRHHARDYIAAHPTIISPDSIFRKIWDGAQIFLLLYVAIAVPYRLAFEKNVVLWSSWFFFDACIDIYFVADLLMSFRTAYYTKQGELEHRGRQILVHYLKGWFAIDFSSCLPVGYIGYFTDQSTAETAAINRDWENPAEGEGAGKGPQTKVLRLLRLLRLLKLLRLARVNRIIARYEQEYYALVSSIKILKIILIVFAVSHWLCCCWYAIGTIPSQYLGADGNRLQGWVERYFGGKSDIADGAQYGVAMYWAMMTMTTVGYGDIAAETEAEYWFVTIAMLVGGFVFGMIVGFLGEMSKNANPAESFRQQKVGLINAFVLLCSPSPAVVNTVRNFLAHHNEAQTAMDTMEILKDLPWEMTRDLAGGMRWIDAYNDTGQRTDGLLAKVPFFASLGEWACILTCAKLKHMRVPMSTIDPETGEREYIFQAGQQGAEFYIVLEGSVLVSEGEAKHTKELGAAKAGDCFGELAVLLPPELKVPRARSAHTEMATNLASLSYYDLRELRAEEPEINTACIPFMEEAVRAYGPAGVDGAPAPLLSMQRYPGQFSFVHQRLEAMDAKLDRVMPGLINIMSKRKSAE